MTRQDSCLLIPATAAMLSTRARWAGRGTMRALAVVALLATSFGLSDVAVAGAAPTGPVAGKVACSTSKTYTVVSGDYWFGIAKKVAVTSAALLAANAATTATPLYPGGVLCLPENATAPTTVPGTGTPTTIPTGGATTTTPTGTTIPPVVSIASFPVQGPCWFTDTWAAARSGGRKHEGVDVIAKSGQFVYAVVDGTLTRQSFDQPGGLSGNAWWLTAPDGSYYFYAHLSAFAPDLGVGTKVVAGQVIGYVGATGNAAASHLHFEVHPAGMGGAPINPTPTVKAVDGCKKYDPPPQPSGSVPPAPAASTTTIAGATTATTVPAPPTNSTPSPGGLWQFLSPVTAFDTAWTGTRVKAGAVTTIRLDNLKGVIPTTGGVMVRITTRGAASGGYLVAHACDAPPPFTASLTFPSSGGVVGTTVVEVVDGAFCLMSNVSAGVKIEIIAQRSTSGVGLVPIRAIRGLDTRTTTRLRRGAAAGVDLGRAGVTADTQAVSATITIVDPSGTGTLSFGVCNQGLWSVPISGESIQSFSIAMRVNSSGWCITTSVDTDVVVDITGLWQGTAGSPAPVDPVRAFDSRTTGVQVGTDPVPVQIAGIGQVPAGATTALVAISTVSGGNPGIVFAMPCDEARSEGAVAAMVARKVVSAVVPARLSGGVVCIAALRPVDVIVDVVAAA